MAPDTRRDHHDWHSADYVEDWITSGASRDEARRPRLRQAVALLPFPADAPLRLLDVGGGYGELTGVVLYAFPHATVCLQDYSVPMVDQARRRLAGFGDRVGYTVSDLRDPGWTRELDGPYDAVVSALAIHNLLDAEAIRRVYADVFGLVRPGGVFFDLDLALDVYGTPAGSALGALYARGAPDYRSDADSGEGHRGEEHEELAPDAYLPSLEDHLRWLREAGFTEVDCVWKRFFEVFLCAFR